MKFHRRIVSAFILLVFAAGALVVASCAASGQAPQSKLSFDVATVKPAAPLDTAQLAADMRAGRMPKLGPEIGVSRATYSYMSLDQLIALGWNVRLYQISGPPWLSQERFDIEATIPEGAKKDDVPAMLRSLLEERFKVVAHEAQEEHKVLTLVVGKGGPKLQESATAPEAFDPDSPLAPGERQVDGLDGPMRMKMSPDGTVTVNMGAKGTVIEKFDRQGGSFQMNSSGVTMGGFAESLSNLFLQIGGSSSQQVVDKTGLKGYYQVDIALSMSDLMAMVRGMGMVVAERPPSGGTGGNAVPEASDPSGGTSVYQSVEHLGLKLEDSKAIVDRLVIDHIEKTPTEN
jgi:uncharacterized protein (TIGR03435 family)